MTYREFVNYSGRIDVDSEPGVWLDFTSNIFEPFSCLWKEGKEIYVGFIATKYRGAGHFRAFCCKTIPMGFTLKIPEPSPFLRDICLRNGYRMEMEEFGDMGAHEIWTKKSGVDPYRGGRLAPRKPNAKQRGRKGTKKFLSARGST
jgi:hypothetical protein